MSESTECFLELLDVKQSNLNHSFIVDFICSMSKFYIRLGIFNSSFYMLVCLCISVYLFIAFYIFLGKIRKEKLQSSVLAI